MANYLVSLALKGGETKNEFGTLYWVHSAHVAQAVEHVLGKDEVTGSSPVVG